MSIFKKLVDTVSGVLDETAQKIKTVIKENTQYIDALEKVVKESKEGIEALKTYATIETPSLEKAINSVADLFMKIEDARQEKTADLRENFINPLNGLIEEAAVLTQEIKDVKNAKSALDKAEKGLEKEKSKKAKGKPADVAGAESKVEEAKKNLAKEESEKKDATEAFNKLKLEKLQNVINAMTDIEKSYHEKIIAFLGDVKAQAEAIKIDEESSIDAIPDAEE